MKENIAEFEKFVKWFHFVTETGNNIKGKY